MHCPVDLFQYVLVSFAQLGPAYEGHKVSIGASWVPLGGLGASREPLGRFGSSPVGSSFPVVVAS